MVTAYGQVALGFPLKWQAVLHGDSSGVKGEGQTQEGLGTVQCTQSLVHALPLLTGTDTMTESSNQQWWMEEWACCPIRCWRDRVTGDRFGRQQFTKTRMQQTLLHWNFHTEMSLIWAEMPLFRIIKSALLNGERLLSVGCLGVVCVGCEAEVVHECQSFRPSSGVSPGLIITAHLITSKQTHIYIQGPTNGSIDGLLRSSCA